MPKRGAVPSNGIGYAGDARGDSEKRKKLQKKAQTIENQTARVHETTLRMGIKSLSSHLEPTSEMLNILKSILRNQADWENRCKLYEVALDCVEGIVQHFPKHLGKDDDDESVLFALLEMVATAEVITSHAQDYAVSVRSLAQRVLDIKSRAVTAARLVVKKEDLLCVDKEDIYRHSMRTFAFDFVDKFSGNHFAKHRNFSAVMSPAQRQRILKELGTYRTALPIEYGSSIFVRALESRVDLLRCMIIGPEESPYACGCFFFDIYLGNYPNEPPKVHFLTTGGGKYRFNPNLYQDGKVCLSLLGTWSGPGWQSGESTLLQVLVSIQSLILVDQPYFNEPGFEPTEGTPQGTHQSKLYNSSIRRYTMDAAILPHLRRLGNGGAPSPYPEFDVIIEKHFTLKEHAWKKQLSVWCREASDTLSQTNGRHGYGYVPQSIGPAMNPLYISCLEAWEDRPQKKKRAKRRGQKASMHATTNAVEKNGVIEIDLDTEPDEDLHSNGTAQLVIASRVDSVARLPPQLASSTNESDVIDLT